MTDWDELLECLHRAMQAITEAHASTPDSQPGTHNETIDAFKAQMETLHRDLQGLKNILDHADAYAEEQLAGALSRMRSGRESDYHRVPRFTEKHRK